MADVKISQLPASTTPLDGTEVLPIVQSATTKQVSVANLTAGRAVSALSLSLTNALPVSSGGTGLQTTGAGTFLVSATANNVSATATPSLGVASTTSGTLSLYNSSSANAVTIASGNNSGAWTFTLPTSGGTNNYILTTNGSGTTQWTNPTALGIDLNVGTTVVSDGTSGRILYNNAGVLGEYSAVPVGFGGTGTSTAFTAGSVVFAGASGVYSQSNSGLFWDNSNNRLGVGTNSPSYLVHAYGNGNNAARIHAQNVGTATDSRALVSFSTNASTYGAGVFLSSTADSAYVASALNLFTFDNQPIVFGTGNTLKMTLDLSGNLGLGVTPSAWSGYKTLQLGTDSFVAGNSSTSLLNIGTNCYYNGTSWIYSSNGLASQYYQFNGLHIWRTAPSGTAGGTITFTQPMTLDASGRLGIGITTPSAPIDLAAGSGTATVAVLIRSLAGNSNGFKIVTNSSTDDVSLINHYSAPLIFGTNNTERARIDASGNLLVGTTTANGRLVVVPASNTQPGLFADSASASDEANAMLVLRKYSATTTTSQVFAKFYVNSSTGSGQINANGASTAAFGSLSDRRIKENIIPIEDQLLNICSLIPCEFDYKNGSGHQIGFIAQEMQQVYPDVVSENENGILMITGWSKTEARLVKAIQELAAKVSALEAKQ